MHSHTPSIDQPQNLLQAALKYASYGWRIFPLQPLSKEPLLPQSWPKIATTDPQQIVEWWTAHPNANIGLVADTLCIIDIDRKPGKPDGWLSIGAFIDQSTPWVATPNNGYHFFYHGVPEKLKKRPGVDIQTGNKYVVAPPSRLPTGAYEWMNPLGTPWDTGIIDLPLALKLELIDHIPQEVSDAELPELIENPPPMPIQELKPPHIAFLERGEVVGFPSVSEVLHSLGARLYRQGFDDGEILSMFLANDFIHETAYSPQHNSAATDTRAQQWLWESLKKVRYHKKQRPTGWAKPQGEAPIKKVIDAAMRVEMGGDGAKEVLQELALINADALDESRVIEILHKTGVAKGVLNTLLRDYKAQIPDPDNPHAIAWKHTVGDDQRPLGTVENMAALLEHKGVRVRHNQMDHRIYLDGNGYTFKGEERFNTQLSQVRSWAAQERLPLETVKEQLVMLAQKDEYHPFKEWVESCRWDGKVRLRNVINTIGVDYHHRGMRDLLVSRWLISIVASVWGYGNRPPRGVLTFTGAQQKGKTTWLYYLVPKGMYHQGLILRPDNRDSATKGLRYLLVELGEVGSTFKASDIEALKAYIGQREDVYRMSYAHDESIWQRRTVFAASANNPELLRDQTGNTRWWVLETESFDLDTMEDLWGKDGQGRELQQFWAEMLVRYQAGEGWDLTDQELAKLEEHQGRFMEISPLGAMLMDAYAFEDEVPEGGYRFPKREMDIRAEMGWGRPFTPAEGRELRMLLRRFTGQKEAVRRRMSLATKDGKKVKYGGDKMLGRYWFMPALRGTLEENPTFKPK